MYSTKSVFFFWQGITEGNKYSYIDVEVQSTIIRILLEPVNSEKVPVVALSQCTPFHLALTLQIDQHRNGAVNLQSGRTW
jgi:hypothetical protein